MSEHDRAAIAPDGHLFRRARQRANERFPGAYSQAAVARDFYPGHARSAEVLRVRLVNFERGALRTIDADLYDALTEVLCAALLDVGLTPDDQQLAYALEDDQLAAVARAAVQRHDRLIARREREIEEAEERLAWLRDGLTTLQGGRAGCERMLERILDPTS